MDALQGFLFVCFSCCLNRILLYIPPGCGSRSHRLGALTGLIQPLSSLEGRSLRPRSPLHPWPLPSVFGALLSPCAHVSRGKEQAPCSPFPWDTSPLAGGSTSLRSLPCFLGGPSRNTTTPAPGRLLAVGRGWGAADTVGTSPPITAHPSSSSHYLKHFRHRALENWEILPNTSVRR